MNEYYMIKCNFGNPIYIYIYIIVILHILAILAILAILDMYKYILLDYKPKHK